MIETDIVEKTKQWIEEFVIKHNLCPFASRPFGDGAIAYHIIEGQDQKTILATLYRLVCDLHENANLSNAFMILPHIDMNFQAFLSFFGMAEKLIEMQGLDQDFQLVSFHPEYQFAELPYDHPVNMTNRSPYIMIHVLRVGEVADAIESFGDTARILEQNKKTLISLFN